MKRITVIIFIFLSINLFCDYTHYNDMKKMYTPFNADAKSAGMGGIQNIRKISTASLFNNPAGLAEADKKIIGFNFNFEKGNSKMGYPAFYDFDYKATTEIGSACLIVPLKVHDQNLAFGLGYQNLYRLKYDMDNGEAFSFEQDGGINFLSYGAGYKYGNFMAGFNFNKVINSELKRNRYYHYYESTIKYKTELEFDGSYFSLGLGFNSGNLTFSFDYDSSFELDISGKSDDPDDYYRDNIISEKVTYPHILTYSVQYSKDIYTYIFELRYQDITEFSVKSDYADEKLFPDKDACLSYRIGAEIGNKVIYRAGFGMNNLSAEDHRTTNESKRADSIYEFCFSGGITYPVRDLLDFDIAVQYNNYSDVTGEDTWFLNTFCGISLNLSSFEKIVKK